MTTQQQVDDESTSPLRYRSYEADMRVESEVGREFFSLLHFFLSPTSPHTTLDCTKRWNYAWEQRTSCSANKPLTQRRRVDNKNGYIQRHRVVVVETKANHLSRRKNDLHNRAEWVCVYFAYSGSTSTFIQQHTQQAKMLKAIFFCEWNLSLTLRSSVERCVGDATKATTTAMISLWLVAVASETFADRINLNSICVCELEWKRFIRRSTQIWQSIERLAQS